MTNKEIIQRVQSLYSHGVESDDTRLSDRHIYNKLITSRAKILTQQANVRKKISDFNYQLIPCIELKMLAIHECPCIPPLGCKMYRSKHKIPKIITSLSKHMIQAVSSLDGTVIFGQRRWNNYKYKSFDKYTSKKPDYFIKNDYLYITHYNEIEVISIFALFEEPDNVVLFPSFCNDQIDCDGNPIICEDCIECMSVLDKEFPLDLDSIENAIQMALNELILQFLQTPEDTSNNSRDSLDQQSK